MEEATIDAITILLSWAVQLSGYPPPNVPPLVEFKPHSFFVANACGGQECNAVGWYNDERIVYIDERLRYEDTMFARSLMVHELVHYLQHLSGRFDSTSCEDSVRREREAYAIQREYVQSHGEVSFIRMHPRVCSPGADDGIILTGKRQRPPALSPD